MVAAALVICVWSLLDAHFNDFEKEHVKVSDAQKQWRPVRAEVEVEQKIIEQRIAPGGTKDEFSLTSTPPDIRPP